MIVNKKCDIGILAKNVRNLRNTSFKKSIPAYNSGFFIYSQYVDMRPYFLTRYLRMLISRDQSLL